MKNILKNASLFIIAMVFTFGFAINVKADDCDGLDYNHCRIGERGVIKINSSSNIKQNTHNTKTKVADARYGNVGVNATPDAMKIYHVYKDSYSALFCLDANLDGYKDLYAERFLLNTGVGIVQIYDAAIMSVLTNGGAAKNSSDYADYWARGMAIRALTYTFGFYNGSKVKYASAYYAGLTVAHNWNEFYKSDFDNLNAAITALGMGARTNPAAKSGYNFTGDNVNKAAAYYVKALNDAASYARKLANMPKVDVANPTAGEVEKNKVSEGNVFVQKDVVHTLKLSKFSKQNNNKFVINPGDENTGVKLDGTYDGLTKYISKIEINGNAVYGSKEAVAGILGKDLVELGVIPENQDVEVKITVHFEGWESTTNSSITALKCGQAPIKYSIDGSYDTGLTSQFGNYVGTVWYSAVPNSQRYIGIEERKDDGPAATPWTSPYETYLIDACSCDNLIDACVKSNNINSDECTELKESNCGVCSWLDASCQLGNEADCEKYNLECDLKCDTYVDTFECCDERGELIVSTLDDHEVSILGPGKDNPDAPSIKACFVNKVDQIALENGGGTEKNNANIDGVKDQKGNSYTLANMKDNKYCSVSCKEDYIMTMPTAKLVNAGRYFTFKAKVEGTKTCFTNTIDRKLFNKEIIDLQEKMVNKYNEYRKWYQLAVEYNYGLDTSSYQSSCPGSCCGSPGFTNYHPTWNSSATVNDWGTIVEKNYEKGYIRITKAPQGVSNSGEFAYEHPAGSVSTHVSPGCCGGCSSCTPPRSCTNCSGYSCSYYTRTDPDHITEGEYYSYLMGIANEKLAELNALREEYQNTIIEFHKCTDDTWSSEINYDPEVYYDYSETDYMNMLSGHIGEMDKYGYSETTDSEQWFCQGERSLNDNYDQCSTGAKTSRSATLEKIPFVKCDKNSCRIEDVSLYYNISNANFAKKASNVTANYRPATLFYNVYPTGEITTSKADDNIALENKLPVALNRERGIYKYQVKMERLGEFYNQAPGDNLGRYVGSSTAVVDPNTLEYNCSYLVNITKTTGWVCDFDDNCDDDCIANCIGPNCDDYCDGTDCIADCIGLGCIYDSGAGSSLLEKVVSLNKLFPYGTKSYNWDVTKTGKAQATVSAIEEKGNSIFDEEPILSITLTPSTAREIKKYNNYVLDEGGYSNKTVSCENRDGFEEIVCYSTFIDDLLAGEFGNVVNENSLIADESYRHGENSEYFSLWPNGFSEEDMIGPAWK